MLITQKKGEGVPKWLDVAEVLCPYALNDDLCIADAPVQPSEILVMQRVDGAVLKKVQQAIGS